MARLGDILIRRGFITEGQLEAALAAQGSERGMLGRILVRRGLVTMDQLGECLAEQFGVPFVDVVPQTVNPQVVRLLPEKLARQRSCVPISVSGTECELNSKPFEYAFLLDALKDEQARVSPSMLRACSSRVASGTTSSSTLPATSSFSRT